MSRDSAVVLRHAIENKRRELIAEIRTHTAGLTVEESEHDPTDQGQSMSMRDQSAGLVVRLSDTLAQIDRSLGAMSGGTYGLCIVCDGEIAQARLRAIPWASHCIHCQQVLEGSESHEFRGRPSYLFDENAA